MKKLPPDPRFDHVDYRHTNLRVTFARVRREQAEQKLREAIVSKKVTTIKRKEQA